MSTAAAEAEIAERLRTIERKITNKDIDIKDSETSLRWAREERARLEALRREYNSILRKLEADRSGQVGVKVKPDTDGFSKSMTDVVVNVHNSLT